MNHTDVIEYRKKLNGDGKHRSTVNYLARGWKVSTSRGECRWALVYVLPSNQKGSRVSIFLVFEGTGGTWERQEAAVGGVSGTEYGCFGTACLETAYNTKVLDLIFCVVCGLTLNCYKLMQPEPSQKKPEILAKATFFLLQYNHSRQTVDIFFAVFGRNSQTCSTRNNKRGGTGMWCRDVQLPRSTVNHVRC